MRRMTTAPRRRTAGVLALAVSIGLLAAGCTAGGDGGDDGGKQDLNAKGDINATDVADLKDGGELRVPLQSFPPNWNYNFLDGTLADTDLVMQAMVQKTFTIGLDGAPHLNENLLTSAEATSDDPLVIEYEINPDATWSDGTPITWKDFEASFRALNGSDPAYSISDPTGYDSMESVTQGETEKDAIVTYATPFSDWKSMFSPLYPASQIGTADGFNNAYADAIPVTAGPFKLEELDTSARTISIVPDENWWGEKPKLDRIIFIALDGDADIDAYLNNEIDLVAAGTTDRFGRVEKAKNTDLRAAPSANYTHVDFSTSGIFEDQDLRLGVQNAIDRQSLADVLVGDLPYNVSLLNNHIFLGTDSGYQDNAGEAGKFDPEAAKKHFEDAGYTGGSETEPREKDGEKLEASITIPAGAASSSQLAQVIQSQLATVGFKLDIKEVPSDEFFESNVTPGAYDMTIFVWGGTGYYAAGASIYHGGEQTQNFGKVSDDETDALLDEVITEPDVDKAAELWNQIDTNVWNLGHSLPIIQSPRVIAIHPEIANYGARPGAADIDWTIVGFTK